MPCLTLFVLTAVSFDVISSSLYGSMIVEQLWFAKSLSCLEDTKSVSGSLPVFEQIRSVLQPARELGSIQSLRKLDGRQTLVCQKPRLLGVRWRQ